MAVILPAFTQSLPQMVCHLMCIVTWTLPVVVGLFSRKGSTDPVDFYRGWEEYMNKALEI